MKKLIVAGLSLGLLAGCGSTEDKNEVKDKPTQKQEVKKNTEQKEVKKKDFVEYTKKLKAQTSLKKLN